MLTKQFDHQVDVLYKRGLIDKGLVEANRTAQASLLRLKTDQRKALIDYSDDRDLAKLMVAEIKSIDDEIRAWMTNYNTYVKAGEEDSDGAKAAVAQLARLQAKKEELNYMEQKRAERILRELMQ